MPTEDVTQLLVAFAPAAGEEAWDADGKSMPLWRGLCASAESTECVAHVMRDLLHLYVFTTLCDPPMLFDASSVGTEMKFSPETATSVDDKIKVGKSCFVMCPALYSMDGMLKSKAQVLAADYL